MRDTIVQAIARRPLIFDGAMGTMIYRRGVFLNVCYDELCLTRPAFIREIHEAYMEAGVDVLETNSFGANRRKLAPYGLAESVAAINRAAIRTAREAAGDRAYVAASVGPCLTPGERLSQVPLAEIEAAFDEQLRVVAEEGADLAALETFHDLDELRLAARIAKGHGLTVLASMAIDSGAVPAGAEHPEETAMRALDADANVDWVGLNCGAGPAELFHPVRRALLRARKPLVVMPNAGGGRDVGGRIMYLNSPEYFTEFCKRYIELGARGIGGCCGTTPAHLRMAVRAVRGMSGMREHIRIVTAAPGGDGGTAPGAPAARPLGEKSRFGARLAAGRRVSLVEILPPTTGAGLPKFIERCRQCEAGGVDAVNLPDGPRASARLSVLAAALSVLRATGIEPIPHYCGRDRTLIGMQADSLGGQALGLNTWLFITGDPPKMGNYPDATGVFDLDSIGLCHLASNLNRALDAGGQPLDAATTIVVGVGANPAAIDLDREVERFFLKIDAGAEYAITQPVFDVDVLRRFLDRVQAHDRTIPILAGIYPLVSQRNAEFMNQHVQGVVVPEAVLERMRACRTKEDGLRVGVEIARETRDAVGDRVAGFQASAPLGKIEVALDVLAP
jgi:homocysteine S-methyltransferase